MCNVFAYFDLMPMLIHRHSHTLTSWNTILRDIFDNVTWNTSIFNTGLISWTIAHTELKRDRKCQIDLLLARMNAIVCVLVCVRMNELMEIHLSYLNVLLSHHCKYAVDKNHILMHRRKKETETKCIHIYVSNIFRGQFTFFFLLCCGIFSCMFKTIAIVY